MKKYVIIVLNQVTVKLQYKFNMGVAFISRTIPIFMSYFLWNNIYNSMNGNKVGNYTRGQMLTYIILVNLTNFLFNFRHMRELGKQIQEGTLTTLLLRPVSILNQSFATFIGDKFFIIIVYLSGILMYGFLGYFKDMLYFLEVVGFMILCFVMFFYLLSFLSTIGFWLIEVWPIQVIMIGVYSLFSGSYFPLDLLPKGIYNIFKYNPFSLIGFASVRTIQGMFSHKEMAVYIFVTIIWMIVLRIGYEKAFRRGLKIYEGVGA